MKGIKSFFDNKRNKELKLSRSRFLAWWLYERSLTSEVASLILSERASFCVYENTQGPAQCGGVQRQQQLLRAGVPLDQGRGVGRAMVRKNDDSAT